jgi:hypothetical protein
VVAVGAAFIGIGRAHRSSDDARNPPFFIAQNWTVSGEVGVDERLWKAGKVVWQPTDSSVAISTYLLEPPYQPQMEQADPSGGECPAPGSVEAPN